MYVTMREEADAITVEKVEASPRQAQAVSHEAVKLTDQVRVLLKEKQTDSYAYQHLTQPEQEIYIEILWALTINIFYRLIFICILRQSFQTLIYISFDLLPLLVNLRSLHLIGPCKCEKKDAVNQLRLFMPDNETAV